MRQLRQDLVAYSQIEIPRVIWKNSFGGKFEYLGYHNWAYCKLCMCYIWIYYHYGVMDITYLPLFGVLWVERNDRTKLKMLYFPYFRMLCLALKQSEIRNCIQHSNNTSRQQELYNFTYIFQTNVETSFAVFMA